MKTTKLQEGIAKALLLLFVASIVAFSTLQLAVSTPYGPVLESTITATPGTTAGGLMRNDTKGKITTLELNATQPNDDWKGYVGNISGTLVLDDADNKTLFAWPLTTITGEIFATREDVAPAWADIVCATHGNVTVENTAMSHGTDPDNISNTFNDGDHKQLIVAGKTIAANACDYSAYMYVNDAAQTSTFSEVLLSDLDHLIYASVFENNGNSYNNNPKDFQMIVADNGDNSINTAYYFYVELG